jgi:hypothetical protein
MATNKAKGGPKPEVVISYLYVKKHISFLGTDTQKQNVVSGLQKKLCGKQTARGSL